MNTNMIAWFARALPSQRSLTAWAVALTVTLSSGACFQSARADVLLNESSPAGDTLPIDVCEWGDDSGNPTAVVLCIHGFSCYGRAFDSLAYNLASEGMVVYAPDLRGFGKAYYSGRYPRVSYDTYADDDIAALARILREMHPDLKLFVCGESMGGALAIRLAVNNPELVDGLVLSAPCIKLKKHFRYTGRSFIRMILHGGKVDLSSQMYQYGGSRPVVTQLMRDPLTRSNYSISELMEVVWITRETRRQVSRIPYRIPILVLQSKDDQTVSPRVVGILRRRLQTADLTVLQYENKGHLLLEFQDPDSDTLKPVPLWLDEHIGNG